MRNPRPAPPTIRMPDGQPADPLRAIADLQRQLDERTAERDEALAQQIATAEVLQVINSSPGDLAPVFKAILERAMRLCEAGFGELDVYDGQHFRVAATLGVPAAFDEYRRNNPSQPRAGSFGGRLIGGRRSFR